MRRVSGFCVAAVLDADPDGPRPWIATEYIDGPSLRGSVRADGPRSGPELHRLAVHTATALTAIHASGVLHRDLKPENIMLAPDGARVIDFGIARVLETTSLTASGLIGTLGYMAPEQLEEGRLTSAVDVFSLGAALVFAATGQEAFPGPSRVVTIRQILMEEPETGDLEGPLLDIVLACLAKDPRERPSAQELLIELATAHVSTAPAPTVVDEGEEEALADFLSEWGWEEAADEASDQENLFDLPPLSSDVWGFLHEEDEKAPARYPLSHVLAHTVACLLRTGLPSVSTDLLARTYALCLPDGESPDEEWFSEALYWATRPAPEGEELLRGDHGGWRLAEPLREFLPHAIPRQLWLTAAREEGADRVAMATRALAHRNYESALRVLVQDGKYRLRSNRMLVGLVCAVAGNRERANTLLQHVAETEGSAAVLHELGYLMHEACRDEEAVYWYQQAATASHTESFLHLAIHHDQRAEDESAAVWWRAAAESGSLLGMLGYADLLRHVREDHGQAAIWREKALARGGRRVLVEAGDLHRRFGHEHESYYRLAAELGDGLGQERLRDLEAHYLGHEFDPDTLLLPFFPVEKGGFSLFQNIDQWVYDEYDRISDVLHRT